MGLVPWVQALWEFVRLAVSHCVGQWGVQPTIME